MKRSSMIFVTALISFTTFSPALAKDYSEEQLKENGRLLFEWVDRAVHELPPLPFPLDDDALVANTQGVRILGDQFGISLTERQSIFAAGVSIGVMLERNKWEQGPQDKKLLIEKYHDPSNTLKQDRPTKHPAVPPEKSARELYGSEPSILSERERESRRIMSQWSKNLDLRPKPTVRERITCTFSSFEKEGRTVARNMGYSFVPKVGYDPKEDPDEYISSAAKSFPQQFKDIYSPGDAMAKAVQIRRKIRYCER